MNRARPQPRSAAEGAERLLLRAGVLLAALLVIVGLATPGLPLPDRPAGIADAGRVPQQAPAAGPALTGKTARVVTAQPAVATVSPAARAILPDQQAGEDAGADSPARHAREDLRRSLIRRGYEATGPPAILRA